MTLAPGTFQGSSYILSWEIEGRFGVRCAGLRQAQLLLGPLLPPGSGGASLPRSCPVLLQERRGSLLIQMLFTPPFCQQLPGSEGASLELQLSPIAYVLGDHLPCLLG